MLAGFIHAVPRGSTLLGSITASFFIVSKHSTPGGYLDCFQFRASRKRDALNVLVHDFGAHMSSFLLGPLRSSMAGSWRVCLRALPDTT